MKGRRIGLLIPSVNTTMEPEFYAMAPENVTVHTARLFLTEVSYEHWLKMFAALEGATRDLATARPDVIVFGCTGASFANGVGWDKTVADRISGYAQGIPVVTTTTAIVRALEHFAVRDVAISTPYPAETDERCRAFIEGSGFRVRSMRGLGIKDGAEIGYLPPESAYEAGTNTIAGASDADALLLSCTNWRTIEVLDKLETALKKPVISSNQASLWAALSTIGDAAAIPGYGRLLQGLGTAATRAVANA